MSSGCGDTALSNAMLTIPTSGNGSNTVYYRATGSYGYRYFQLSPQTGAFILNSPAVCGSDSGGNGC
jgi:hypothetical protein